MSLRRRQAAFALAKSQSGMTSIQSLLSTWRRQVREGRLGTDRPGGFMPVRLVAASQQATASPGCDTASGASGAPGIEIILADGTRLYIRHTAQVPLLRPVIAALRG